MKNKLYTIIVVLIAIALTIASYFFLMETVLVQISITGEPTTYLPKVLAIFIPLAIVIIPLILNSMDSERFGKAKYISLIGILAQILTILYNYH